MASASSNVACRIRVACGASFGASSFGSITPETRDGEQRIPDSTTLL
jgi:hypothetical protein